MTESALETTITILKRTDMPSAPTRASGMPTISSSSETFSTPSVTVPPSNNNPYILRTSGPLGVVFIAVGSVVGAILIAFALYYLYKSLSSSRMAKRTMTNEKFAHQKYQGAFGPSVTPQTLGFFHPDNSSSVAKLPLLNSSKSPMGGSQVGESSTIFTYEGTHPTSHHDLTHMFVSPTRDVMAHNRTRSQYLAGSVSNFSFNGGSKTNLTSPSPATNRHSQVPNLYINEESNNSDYSVVQPTNQERGPDENGNMPREGKRTLPSMYLEDLIDK